MSENDRKIELVESRTNSLSMLNTPEQLIAFGEKLIQSQLVPHKNASDVMAAILLGRELGLGVMTSVNHINSINGRGSVGIHIITAKLLQAGVTFRILKDSEDVVTTKYQDKTGATHDELMILENLDKFQIISKKTAKEKYETNKIQVIKVQKIVDIVSVIEFKRKVKQPDNTYTEMTIVSTYSMSDAVAQGLAEKENWKKMPKIMLRTRNLSIGSRLIASDVVMGIYEHSELADANNIPYKVQETEEGVVVVVEDKKISN